MCDVIATHLLTKVFFVSYATKTSVLQQFKLLHVVVLQQRSQKDVFIKR